MLNCNIYLTISDAGVNSRKTRRRGASPIRQSVIVGRKFCPYDEPRSPRIAAARRKVFLFLRCCRTPMNRAQFERSTPLKPTSCQCSILSPAPVIVARPERSSTLCHIFPVLRGRLKLIPNHPLTTSGAALVTLRVLSPLRKLGSYPRPCSSIDGLFNFPNECQPANLKPCLVPPVRPFLPAATRYSRL